MAPPAVQDYVGAAIRSSVVAPFLALEAQVLSAKDARVRFAIMKAERDAAVVQAFAIRALIGENQQLRALAALSQRLPTRHVTAEILPQAGRTEGYTFLLSKGREALATDPSRAQEAVDNLRAFVQEMATVAQLRGFSELHEPTFFAAFKKLCPLWPFC